MFKKLRRQIILIEMLAFMLVTIVIVGTINFNAYRQMEQSADQVLNMLEDGGGIFLENINDDSNANRNKYDFGFGLKLNEETKYITRYFIVKVDDNGEVTNCDMEHIAAVTDSEIDKYVSKVMNKNAKRGMISDYRYLKVSDDEGITIYFVDCYQQLSYVRYVANVSITIALLCMCFVFVFVYILSGKVIRPLEDNLDKQKRFITDAGHELKTPLAAISANADVLELVSGENEITSKIKIQTKKLDVLVNEMLTLAKMDGAGIKKENVEEIDLSELVNSVVSNFNEIAISKHKNINLNVADNIMIKGIRKDIDRLISVLVDNAVKYCLEKGNININMNSTLRQVRLVISNSSEPISNEDIKHLFERFYRTDISRSRDTGSYGIGLSIAQAIVANHKGHINVKNGNGCVEFIVELPLK